MLLHLRSPQQWSLTPCNVPQSESLLVLCLDQSEGHNDHKLVLSMNKCTYHHYITQSADIGFWCLLDWPLLCFVSNFPDFAYVTIHLYLIFILK